MVRFSLAIGALATVYGLFVSNTLANPPVVAGQALQTQRLAATDVASPRPVSLANHVEPQR